jgi:putative oligomerization/nucleic acid binding protein
VFWNDRGMFRARRRPLLRAAMVGGGAYVAGKHRARTQEAEAQQTQYQDDRISALEQQQAQAAPPTQPAAPAAAAPAAGGGGSIVDQLKQLSDLKTSGALSDQEFEAAKAKLLGGG